MKLTAKTIAVAILAAALMASVAALGQAASTTPSASQYQYGPGGDQYGPAGDQYGKKVKVCHKGRTISVSQHALKGHRHHHDALGLCVRHKHHHGHHKGQDAQSAQHDQSAAKHEAGHDDDHGKGEDEHKDKGGKHK